jgi:HK97 family phage major capsid protein
VEKVGRKIGGDGEFRESAKRFFKDSHPMKTIKFSKQYGEHAPDSTTALEDNVADFVIKGGFGVEHKPDEKVVQKAAELRDRLVKQLVDRIYGDVQFKATGKRPDLVVNPDNNLADPTDGFKSSGEFYIAVRKARTGERDERLTRRLKANGASENIDADGGYATPVQYATSIYNDIISQQSLFNSCFTIPMESNSMKLPALNYIQQGQFGVTAYWEGEGAQISTSKPAYRQPQLTLNKLTVLTPVTSELMEDGIAIESIINFLTAEAMTYKINDAIINGTGAGQPTGIVSHPSTVVVTRTAGLEVQTPDVIAMDSAFDGNQDRSVWLISKRDVNPQLLQLQDANGRYLYFAPGTMGDVKGPPNLLGTRVMPLINCQPLGNQGDIIKWDAKSYVIGYKSTGMARAMSIHIYFLTDEIAYRTTFRMDGRPWRDTTLSGAKSTSLKYSPCVVLNTNVS